MYVKNFPTLQRLKRDELYGQAGKYILGAVIAGCIFWALIYGVIICYFRRKHDKK